MKTKLTLTTKTTSKLTLKHTTLYALASLGIAALLFTGAFLYFNLGSGEEVSAMANPDYTSHANKNSAWNDASTWYNVPHWKTPVPQVGTYWTMKLNGTVTYQPPNPNNTFNHSPCGSVMELNDTLIIKSDANFGNVVNVSESGVLVIYGDMNIQAGNLIKNNGRVVVTGNLTTNDNSTLTNNASPKNGFYIFGNTGARSDGKAYCKNLKNETDLATNDPSLYEFVKSGGFAILPITLADFQASLTSSQTVHIEWSTFSEKNNDFFTIERSADGKNFEVLTTVKGAGNSNKKLNYSFEDGKPLVGYNYYRLKQTDFNGDFEYFNIVGVNCLQSKVEAVQNINITNAWPNPFAGHLNISFETEDAGEVEILVQNVYGEVVHQISHPFNYGENTYILDQTESLKSGIYFVTLGSNGKKVTQKVIKM